MVELRDVEAHLIYLLQTICLFVILNKVLIISKLTEIVFYSCIRVCHVNWSKEVNYNWCSSSNLCFDTSLDRTNLLPEIIIGSSVECTHKPILIKHLDDLVAFLILFIIVVHIKGQILALRVLLLKVLQETIVEMILSRNFKAYDCSVFEEDAFAFLWLALLLLCLIIFTLIL